MTAIPNPPDRQVAAVERWLGLFLVPGTASELRGLGVGNRKAVSEIFADVRAMATRAVEWDRAGAKGVYFTPNPVDPLLIGNTHSCRAEDICRRHWLLIDADPTRPAGTNSTDAERLFAWLVLDRARGILETAGFRNGVLADSGNGWHLTYPIDIAADAATQQLIRSVLIGLDKRCSDDRAKIDKTPHDAPRIWKCYGTRARKGEHSDERPQRWARVIEDGDAAPVAWEINAARENTEALKRLPVTWKQAEDLARGRPVGERPQPLERARLYVAKMPPAVSGQGGHNQTWMVAQAVIRGFSLPEDDALEILREYNARCVPPWSEQELRHKANDARNKSTLPFGYLLEEGGQDQGPGPFPSEGPAPAPQGPPPAPETWGKPIPLNRSPEATPFPLDVLPAPIRRYVEEVAWSCNAPPDFAAVPVLVCAGGAIGNARRLAITRTHHQGAALFAATIGRPGSGKSTPFDFAKYPLEQAEARWRTDYSRQNEDWEQADLLTRGEKPVLRRCLCDDTTTEALVGILRHNPRGLTMARDELAALITGMDQYRPGGKGSDRQTFLKVWSGSTVRVDRTKLDGMPLIVTRPFLAVCGTIQPGVIEWMKGDAKGDKAPPDDGFLDRFLLSYPADLPAIGEQWRDVSEEASLDWQQAVDALLDLDTATGPDGDPTAKLVPLTSEARLAWADLTQQHADEVNAEGFEPWLLGPWAKLVPGYAGRLSLILQMLRWTSGEADLDAVDDVSVQGAFALVRYFKAHAKRVYAYLGADPRALAAYRVLSWIRRRPGTTSFSRADAYEHLRRNFKAPDDLTGPLDLLVQHRYLRYVEAPARTGPGRRPTPKYDVNPAVFQEGRDEE